MPLPRNFKLDADERARLGGLLLRLSRRYERALEERLKRFRIGPTHYELLKLLYAAADYSLTHSELAQALGITLPSVSTAAKKLSAMGLIAHRKGKDRRERIATLSVKGAEQLAPLYDANEGFAEDLFTAIDEKDARHLERAVTALLARLAALEAARP
jgi:DNA-binding MarR family transcriptional regulator